jgi:hypothetical protein
MFGVDSAIRLIWAIVIGLALAVTAVATALILLATSQ